MRSRFNYVVDEDALTLKQGKQIPPLRVFNLESFGIASTSFLEFMRPAFSLLHLDPYDAKRNKVAFLKKLFPTQGERLDRFLADYYAKRCDLDAIADLIAHLTPDDRHEFDRIGLTGRRKRSIARFIFQREKDAWTIERKPASEFRQNVGKGDVRALVRKFAETSEFVTEYPPLLHLMRSLADMVREIEPDVERLEMNLHMMFIFADLMSKGENAPEGIHQDGADYIVSALVIERAGIIGGESIVYDTDKKTEFLRRTLAEGEGIFQSDHLLWHYVTPIEEDPAVPPAYGHRSILGFDMKIL